ncbi:hypothetical protein [Macrococcoides caseolyticum]|uniref:hypothetical protein n=1 Tax=Macrococcoides caseolyticum TaxID=69966 RepID=UPI00105DEA3A|nr:hypothetical protein [Macrococcus caseolyticus]TDM18848.1 hypothetical protein ETI00_02500 [Macrococcus caseolyticus]
MLVNSIKTKNNFHNYIVIKQSDNTSAIEILLCGANGSILSDLNQSCTLTILDEVDGLIRQKTTEQIVNGTVTFRVTNDLKTNPHTLEITTADGQKFPSNHDFKIFVSYTHDESELKIINNLSREEALAEIDQSVKQFISENTEEYIDKVATSKWLYENNFKPKEAVTTFNDLPQDAELKELRGVTDENAVYVYDGERWVKQSNLNFDGLSLIDKRLNSESVNVLHAPKGFKSAVGDGNTDDSITLQKLIDEGVRTGTKVFIPKKIYNLTNGKMRTGAAEEYHCLKFKEGLRVEIEPGAVFKLAENAPAWSRVIVIENDVTIEGRLTVDGSAETVVNGNEHMAGVFIYGKQNIRIDSIYSYNCYGDNVQISGDGTTPSKNISIGDIRARKAGRKNLVLEAATGVHIKKAVLDNTEGNSTNGWKGGGSLDIEPFDMQNFVMHNRIDYLETIGDGNDFTAGDTEVNADACLVDIGTFIQRRGKFLVYAMTLNIDNAYFYEDVSVNNLAFESLYASRININQAYFDGFGGGIISAFQVASGEKPKITIKKMTIRNSRGLTPTKAAFLWKSADITIETLDISGYDERIIWSETTGDAIFKIGSLISNNSGKSGGSALYLNYLIKKSGVHIDYLSIFDTRTTKVGKFIEFSDEEAMQNFSCSHIQNVNNITLFGTQYDNFTPALKIAGIDDGVSIFIIDDTPEGKLIAPVGSMALRRNGTVGNTLYIKEEGTKKTGWKAK